MRICGLDLSLCATGIAYAVTGVPLTWETLSPPKGYVDLPRLDWMATTVTERLANSNLVVIEELAFSRNQAYAKENAGLAYLVRYRLWKRDIPFVLVGANQLKKFVCGMAGSANSPVHKELVLRELWRRFRLAPDDNNAADACVLAMIGRALIGEYVPEIEPQREVLRALQKTAGIEQAA
jgi:Holliday junction resolvasome RuvABC endonuclease subunit